MGIVIDLIIIGIVILSTYLAYKKGLVSLAIKLCAFIIAITVTIVLYKPVANLVINVSNIDETIENSILEKANDVIQENTPDNELTGQIIDGVKEGMLPETARSMAVNIVTGIVIIILYIATNIALRFVSSLAKLLTSIPLIKQIDKLGGIIYGIFRGILIIYVTLIIINIFGMINENNKIQENINKSFVGKVMYENNIFEILF